MKIVIPVFEGCMSLTSLGSMELLIKADALHAAHHPFSPRVFEVELVAVGANPVVAMNGVGITCHRSMAEVERADLVIIPAFEGSLLEQLERNRAVVPWVRELHRRGADVASACTGAFVLAEAGVLDGRRATTHWAAARLFRQRYPAVQLAEERILVDEGRVCTCGGATAFLNLAVYLVEKFCGQATATLFARMLLVDVDKAGQGAYAIFSVQKDHDDEAVRRAQVLIEQDPGSMPSVDELAHAVATSNRTFIRRFKSATGNTPLEYIQRVRVEAAKRALENTTESVDRIAQRVGYDDLGAFRRIFRRYVGLAPREYREKYTRRGRSARAA